MKALLTALLAAGATPAAAQHQGHAMPTGMEMPADPHSGHDMAQMPPADAGGQELDRIDPKPSPAQEHEGHDMPAATEPAAPPVAPPSPAARSGPAHAADPVYGAEAMAAARAGMRAMHGDIRTYRVLIDQAETRIRRGRDGWYVNGEAWYGGDIDRLRLEAEAEGRFGRSPEHAEIQALWSHAVDPWFNLQGGLRYDVRPDPERAWLTAGVQGLAPYWLEVEAALFLSTKGEVTARAEAEYDLRLTRKLILQPRIEVDLSAQPVPELRLGSGLSSAQAGLRLRYQLVPEVAPYVGVAWERAFGDTAGFRRAGGDRAGGWSLVLGVRTWF